MTDIPTFHADGSFVIKLSTGPVTVYTGLCPYDWYDRRNFKPGLPVIMDGVVRKIKSYGWFATVHGPRIGSKVELIFEEPTT